MKFTIEQIHAMAKQIEQYDYAYYVLQDPLVADSLYDDVVAELKSGLAEHGIEQAVPGQVGEQFQPVEYSTPMLSLASAFTREDIERWYSKVRKQLGGEYPALMLELKIDGIAISLKYEGGFLTQASTRGTGAVGEDVTHNIASILHLRHTVKAAMPKYCELRGEVFLPKSKFHEINEELTAQGLPTYANPRNAASGIVRQANTSSLSNKLDAFVYWVADSGEFTAPFTQTNALGFMKTWGLPVNPVRRYTKDFGEVVKYYEDVMAMRDGLDFEIDGIVIKVDETFLQQQLGVNGHDPNWAIAWKFPAQQTVTRLNDITVQLGRFGKLTPVAQLEPVALAGVTVKHASLHNAAYIETNDIRVGDMVVVERAGDVIPQVVKPMPRTEDLPKFKMPAVCYACSGPITREDGEVDYRCAYDGCPAKLPAQFIHFTSKGVMDIEGLGGKWCEVMVDRGLVKNPAEIYFVSKPQLLSLHRMGNSTADKILANVEASKVQPLAKVVYALGIFRLGHDLSRKLAEHYKSLDAIAELQVADLMQLDSIGQKRAESIVAGFQTARVQLMIKLLKLAGVTTAEIDEAKVEEPRTGLWSGMQFVLTGAVPGLTRAEAYKIIEGLGGKPSDKISVSTTYLVSAGKPSGKTQAAAKLNSEGKASITVITAEDFARALVNPIVLS